MKTPGRKQFHNLNADMREDTQDASSPLRGSLSEDTQMFAGTLQVPPRPGAEVETPWRLPGGPLDQTAPSLARDEDEDLPEEEDEEEDDEDEDEDDDFEDEDRDDDFDDEDLEDFEDKDLGDDFDDEDFDDEDYDEDYDDE